MDESEGRSGGDGNCFVAHWPCNLARGRVARRLGRTKKTGDSDMEEQKIEAVSSSLIKSTRGGCVRTYRKIS